MNKLLMTLHYAGYYLTSHNAHHIHSPFVYQLYTRVISPDKNQKHFKEIEQIRKQFLNNHNKIPTINSTNSATEKSIADIAKNSLKSPRYARLIYRLATYFNPSVCVELGTSLGISTLYLASAIKGKVITLEGNDAVLQLARQEFDKSSYGSRIETVQGMFDETLPGVLAGISKTDFVFFDGNHQYEPTLKYFNMCLDKVHSKSVFVFDDINWSEGKKRAWNEIKNHPKVTVTIDLFMMGLVFFDPDLSKQDFVLRY